MKTFKEWLKSRNEAFIVGAKSQKDTPQDAGGIWGAPETAGKSPGYAHAAMEKNLKQSKKGSKKQ
jgi:hypothetical protein